MSGAVDNRIVKMEFQNSAFSSGVTKTLGMLDKLKKGLSFGKTKDPLEGIEKSSGRFNLGHVVSSIDGVKNKLSTMRVVGVAALVSIANKAVTAGLSLAKSLTLDPVMAGFHEYETQLNSVQTILANTQASGAKLSDVNGALYQLNKYADKTIYNFSEMAKNIGTFTAAGVDLDTSVQSIKGIANMAALSGSNAQQASTAMYQLSQAISAGRVGLQDWNSVVNAGMGGTVFQRALAQTAEAMGTLDKGAVKLSGSMKNVKVNGNSFRESIQAKPGQQSWLTSDVLTTTLKQFTGDMTDAQLAAIGFSKAQIKAIQAQAKTAQDAATKVKTFSQLMDTLKESVGSGWTQTFQTIFGNFNEAKKLWTGAYTVLSKMINHSANARNKMLKDWKNAGGRTAVIDAFSNAFQALMAVIKPIKQAFHDIFPAMTGQRLADLSKKLRDFTAQLKIGPETADKLRRTFRGLFAALDIGKQVIVGVFHMLGTLFHTISGGSGSILDFTGNVGDFIVKLDKALKKGDGLNGFFENLGGILAKPLQLLGTLKDLIAGLFAGFALHDAQTMQNSLNLVQHKLSGIFDVGVKVRTFFTNLWAKIKPGIDKIKDAFGSIVEGLGNAFSGANSGQLFRMLNTGLLAGIAVFIRKFFKNGINIDVGGGIFGQLKETFEGLNGNLKAMQSDIKSNTLLKIAAAVGILAASAVALATVDSKRLNNAMTAMATGFGELLISMKLLTGISKSAGFLKVPLIAASMDLLAGAILLLSLAVRSLAKLNLKELHKGLTAVGVLLGELSGASFLLSKSSGGLIRAGVGITAIAVALNILYFAVKDFAKLSWGELIKGLTAVAGSLVGIAAGMRLMPKGLMFTALGLLEVSGALLIIYKAVSGFASLSWGQLLKGLAGVAGSLVAIAGAMHIMPKGMIFQAGALILVAVALGKIGKAVAKMGGLSWSQIARGLVGLGGALAELVIALNLMDGAVTGAAALFIVAAGLKMLVPVIKTLGGMSWGDLVKGLVALAGTFAVIGVAGLLLQPVAPALLALGAAMVLIGGGFALFGLGAQGLAKALGILATTGSAGIKVLLDALQGIIDKLPSIGKNLAAGLVNFVKEIASNAPAIVASLAKVLGNLLDAVVKLAPKMARAISAVIKALLKVIRDNFPRIVDTGFRMLMSLLKGIEKNIGKVTQTVINIIVKFIDTVSRNLGRIIQSGVNLLTQFLVGVARALGHIPGVVLKVIGAFLGALLGGLWKIAKGGAQLIGKLIEGIAGAVGRVVEWGARIVGHILSGIGGAIWHFVEWGGKIVSNLVRGLASMAGNLLSAGWDLAKHIVDGIIQGISNLASSVWDSVKNLASGMLGSIGDFLGISSPSKEFMKIGHYVGQGLAIGIKDMHKHVADTTTDMAKGSVSAMVKTISGLSDTLSSGADFNPVITPVLDLTQVRKDASTLNGLVTTKPITANVSYAQASDISRSKQTARSAADATTPAAAAPAVIKFEQTNNSPKALSTADIYRQTKNQLSQAKKLFGVPTQ